MMPDPTGPVDPLAAAQAAAMAGLAKAKVHPIRQGIEERAAVKCVTAEFFLNDIEEPHRLVHGPPARCSRAHHYAPPPLPPAWAPFPASP